MNKIHFPNNASACLFASEIIGQLSDGYFENTRPYDHWEFWAHAEIVVDGNAYTEGTPKKSNYNLSPLRRYVKEEMKNAIRFTKSRWYSPELIGFKRLLTEKYSLENIRATPFAEVEEFPYDPEVDSEWTLKSNTRTVVGALPGKVEPSQEFLDALHKELVRILIEDHNKSHLAQVDRQREQAALLEAHGINAENYAQVGREILGIPVSDSELNSTLETIMKVMSNCHHQ